MRASKTVFIASDPPMPPTGGGTRTYHCARALASISICRMFILFPVKKELLPASVLNNCFSVSIAAAGFAPVTKGNLSILLKNIRLIIAPWSFPKNEIILAAAYYASNPYIGKNKLKNQLFTLQRYIITFYAILLYRLGYLIPARSLERYHQYQEMKQEISKTISGADLVWIDFSTLFPFFLDLRKMQPDLKIVCNAHNLEYRLLERMKSLAKDKLEKRWINCQATVMKKVELKGFSDCDLVIVCSEEDKKEIQLHLPDSHIEVIPNGVDINFFTPHSNPNANPTLLFTGTMGYEPNRDAVEYFIERIFPIVNQLSPSCKFCIAGANADSAFKQYSGNRHIEIISSPADMRPIYDRAWVVVVPLRSGSGTRLKILEAMAMEKPVVSTSIGAEGIIAEDSRQLFIADGEQDFADKIVRLIEDRKGAAEIAIAAKETILKLYNWDSIREKTISVVRHYTGE
jgi:polysaccharide biosynthesis protein PslH